MRRHSSWTTLQPLVDLNHALVMEAVERLGLARLMIDVDGSVVRTGAKVAWAFRGFNPHHRKDFSYYLFRDVLSWLRRQHRCSWGLGKGRRWSLARGGRGRASRPSVPCLPGVSTAI